VPRARQGLRPFRKLPRRSPRLLSGRQRRLVTAYWTQSASGRPSPDHPCWDDQAAIRWPLTRMPR
jgi:hypothetical protein